jgi:heptosyltransferase-3
MSANIHIDFNSIKRVLVIKLRNHGDVLLTTPVFNTLKQQFPHLEVDALSYKDTSIVLEENPNIDQIHTIDRNWKYSGPYKQLKHELSLTKALMQRKYDLVIHLTEHHRGAVISLLTRPQYSITALNWKRTSWLWKKCFSFHYPTTNNPRHTIETNLDSLRYLGLSPETQNKKPTIAPGEAARESIQATLNQNSLLPGKFIVFHPTSRWMFKSWPPESSAKLVNELAKSGIKVVITASPDKEELRYIDIFKGHVTEPITCLSGQLSIKELSELISKSAFFVGMDSLPMHIASAFDIATLAVFGPSNEKKWGPWTDKSVVFTSEHSCRPCDLAGCADGGISDCLVELNPDIAASYIRELIKTNETD